jgi:hypothetical protein
MNNTIQNNNNKLSEKEKKIKKSLYDKEYRLKNKEKILERNKSYNSRLEIKERRKEYDRIKNNIKREYISKQKREYNSKPEVKKRKKEREKKYLSNPKNIQKLKEYRKQYYTNPKNILKRREYYNNRLKKDIFFKISKNLRCRFLKAIKNNYKNTSSIELLGCSIEEFKNHLESKFKNGMTWKNHGKFGWHIDHIIPCASFDLTNSEEQKKCFHYTNLQPLWWIENLKKSNKIK